MRILSNNNFLIMETKRNWSTGFSERALVKPYESHRTLISGKLFLGLTFINHPTVLINNYFKTIIL